jgi:RNA polymerase sigma-54 factor
MKMGFELTMQQTQKLVMTQQLQLSIKLLQLPSLELNEYIQGQLEENPVLDTGSEDKQRVEDKEFDDTKIDWKEVAKDYEYDSDYDNSYQEDDENSSPLNFVSMVTTLQDHLIFQLRLTLKDREDIEIGEYLIENIDGAGYLRIDIQDAALSLHIQKQKVEDILSIIQSFDPPGIGARDLKECLKIQLSQSEIKNELLEKIIDKFLNEIAENKYDVIAKELSITPREAQSLGDIIKGFEPKPGSGFADSQDIKYITPDVYVEKVNEKYMVSVNEKITPRLSINPYYRNILKNEGKDKETADYIKKKLDSAAWLIKSIEQRKSTLYNVVNSIVDYQKEFFEKGIDHLKPLTLKDIADVAGIHESTVSRAVNGKYAQTPRGLYELKFFFTRGLEDNSGAGVSTERIKNRIREMIAGEDGRKPMSDQKISDILNREGINISRRTVAKYREEMDIPATSKRKRY